MNARQRHGFQALVALAAVLGLAGCAVPIGSQYPSGSSSPYPGQYPGQYPATYPATYPDNGAYGQSGRVSNVEYLQGRGTGGVAGAVVGGAVGGLAGYQIGKGSGRTAATIVGMVGGALVGHAIERNMDSGRRGVYRVTVQFDDGAVRSFDYAEPPDVRVGERVRAQGNQLYR